MQSKFWSTKNYAHKLVVSLVSKGARWLKYANPCTNLMQRSYKVLMPERNLKNAYQCFKRTSSTLQRIFHPMVRWFYLNLRKEAERYMDVARQQGAKTTLEELAQAQNSRPRNVRKLSRWQSKRSNKSGKEPARTTEPKQASAGNSELSNPASAAGVTSEGAKPATQADQNSESRQPAATPLADENSENCEATQPPGGGNAVDPSAQPEPMDSLCAEDEKAAEESPDQK